MFAIAVEREISFAALKTFRGFIISLCVRNTLFVCTVLGVYYVKKNRNV